MSRFEDIVVNNLPNLCDELSDFNENIRCVKEANERLEHIESMLEEILKQVSKIHWKVS